MYLLEGSGREPTRHNIRLALGAEQHPSTQLWQVWISRNSTDTAITEIKWVAVGDLFDDEEVLSILDRLYELGDGEPKLLPGKTMRTICHKH